MLVENWLALVDDTLTFVADGYPSVCVKNFLNDCLPLLR
jgi:hypothetical protein